MVREDMAEQEIEGSFGREVDRAWQSAGFPDVRSFNNALGQNGYQIGPAALRGVIKGHTFPLEAKYFISAVIQVTEPTEPVPLTDEDFEAFAERPDRYTRFAHYMQLFVRDLVADHEGEAIAKIVYLGRRSNSAPSLNDTPDEHTTERQLR